MSRPFHLAVPAGDLKDSVHFYEKILECKLGNREEGKWIDVDFWGNELTLHKTNMKLPSERHEVDMGSVPVPHFGVHLEPKIFEKIKNHLICIQVELRSYLCIYIYDNEILYTISIIIIIKRCNTISFYFANITRSHRHG